MKNLKIFSILATLAVLSINLNAKPDIGFVDGSSFTVGFDNDGLLTFPGVYEGSFDPDQLAQFVRDYQNITNDMREALLTQVDLDMAQSYDHEYRFTRADLVKKLQEILRAYRQRCQDGNLAYC